MCALFALSFQISSKHTLQLGNFSGIPHSHTDMIPSDTGPVEEIEESSNGGPSCFGHRQLWILFHSSQATHRAYILYVVYVGLGHRGSGNFIDMVITQV